MLKIMTVLCAGIFITMEGIRDLYKRKISVYSTILFGIMGIMLQIPNFKEYWLSIAGGILVGVIIFILSKVTKGKIGDGDAWVLTVTGVFLGFRSNVVLLLLSLWMAAAVSILLLILKKAKRKTELPFVCFMIPGYILLLIIMS